MRNVLVAGGPRVIGFRGHSNLHDSAGPAVQRPRQLDVPRPAGQ